MNPRRKSRLSIVLFVLLGVSVATALVLYALGQNIDLFYTPSEVVYSCRWNGCGGNRAT